MQLATKAKPNQTEKDWGERNVKKHILGDPISSCVSGTQEMSMEGERNGFIAICAVRCPSTWSLIFLQAGSWTSSPIANPSVFPHSCLTYVSHRAFSSNAEKRFMSTVQEKVSFPVQVWILHQQAKSGEGNLDWFSQAFCFPLKHHA